jgi:hypothetical protein
MRAGRADGMHGRTATHQHDGLAARVAQQWRVLGKLVELDTRRQVGT